MEIRNIAGKCHVVTFYQWENIATNIMVVEGEDAIYICDTFLGPACMEQLQRELLDALPPKQIKIFNSHADWDHHWGNCFFEGKEIIGHELTRSIIIERGQSDLESQIHYKQGNVSILPPNRTFKNKLEFERDGITFFHSPGHTPDSSSCLARTSGRLYSVLFTGDNVESPIPYINSSHLDEYMTTLERYLDLDVSYVVPGHGIPVAGNELIVENINYLEKLKAGQDVVLDGDFAKQIHEENLKVIG
ncbi:MAG: MBL fold metallo-hydrolase [Promethearchaeota archaeon]